MKTKYTTGAVLNPFDHRDISVSAFETPAKARPSKVILDLSKITPKSQLSHGSCVGHAETTAIEYNEVQDRGASAEPLSPRDLYGECKKRDNLPAQGTFPRVAGLVIVDRGIATNKEVPNDCTLPYDKYIDTKTTTETAQYSKQQGFASVPIDYKWIADQIAKGRIVCFTMPTMGADLNSTPMKPSATTLDGWHRVAFYGYEDISADDGVLYVVNSWGDVWGFKVQGLGGYHGCNTLIFSDWKTKLGDIQAYTDIPYALLQKAKEADKDFSYTFTTDLKRGMKGEAVQMLQKALLLTGDYYNVIKGDTLDTAYFGVVTEKSVKRFQARNGLPVTGYFGRLSRLELNTELADIKKKS